jgi:hypothetical protein
VRVVLALFLGALGCLASSPLESRLDHQLRFWQKRLGLEEWNLTLRVVRQSEIGADSWGTAAWYPESKKGTINVLDPRDYNLKGAGLKRDMECTIVHELVHIQVSPFTSREEFVNQIMTSVMNGPCPN